MVSLRSAAQSANVPSNLIFNKTTPAAPSDSFVKELIAELQGFIDQSGNGSHFQIDIQNEPGQTSGSRQFLVTVKSAAPAIALTTASAIDKSKMSPTDAYWAEQPSELQALRYMPEDE